MESPPNEINRWIAEQPTTEKAVKISVVIPAYNEEWRIPPTLLDLTDFFDSSGVEYEIIVVDDGSTDQTAAVVRKFEKIRHQIRLVRYPRNHGKGYAVRTGVLNCRGKSILITDADGSTPIREVQRLMPELEQGADLVIGSRALASTDTHVETRWYRKYLGRTFNKCVNFLLLPGIADTQCGFKLFRAEVARFLFEHQKADGFSFDVEILYLARRAGLQTKEVAINWTNVPGSKVNLLLDAARMFLDLFRFKFNHHQIDESTYTRYCESSRAVNTQINSLPDDQELPASNAAKGGTDSTQTLSSRD